MAFPSVAAAADLYVDATADPGGDGSEGSPFLEIQEALDQAVAGDVVHVLPGTYAPIATVTDGTGAAPITVVAEPAGEAVVQADGTALAAHHQFHTIQGLVFDGGYGAEDTVDTDGANNLELFDVEIRRSGTDCLDLHSVQEVLIANSSIHHCVTAKGDAHGVTGDSVFDVEIRDTEIYLVSGDAVQMSPTRAAWDELLLRRCMLWGGPLDEDANGVAMGTTIGDSAVETKVGLELDGSGSPPTLTVEDVVAFGFGGPGGDQGAFFIEEQVDAQLVSITVYDSAVGLDLRGPAQAQVHNAVLHELGTGIRYATGLTGASVLATTLGGDIAQPFFDDGGDPPVDLRIDNLLVLGDAVPDIAMGGTSAGGGLTLATVHRLKSLGYPLPGVLYLGTPWADLTKTGDTQFTNENLDRVLVTYDNTLGAAARLYAGMDSLTHPLISPVYGGFDGFPPTILTSGTRDLFLSDVVRVHRKMRAAGVVADLHVYEAMSHAGYIVSPQTPESKDMYREVGAFFRRYLVGAD